MKIEHIAIYVKDLEKSKEFYQTYFGAESNEKYQNESKGFESYFLSFEEGCRLEIMSKTGIKAHQGSYEALGITHLAFSVGSREKVDLLTDRLKKGGFALVEGPRTTGDGYYESLFLDPDGNRVEISV